MRTLSKDMVSCWPKFSGAGCPILVVWRHDSPKEAEPEPIETNPNQTETWSVT